MADQVSALRARLEQALAECERLRRENERLTSLLGQGGHSPPAAPGEAAPPAESPPPSPGVCAQSPAAEKVALFQGLFRGRDDLYAVRWESKAGKSGYSPACSNEWVTGVCEKPRVKCGACDQRVFLPLDQETIEAHLRGTKTVGVYPLLPDETCWFLAADFDKAEWQADARAFGRAAQELDVPAAVERSRSGRGAHVWVFFSRPVPSRLARELGSAILTRAMESRYQLGLDSYDRLFPSQDTMPKGGFGSLIALPLQGGPRQEGNSLCRGPGVLSSL